MNFNLKIEGSTPPQVMSLSFLLAFACTEKSVLVLEGKCIASLQEDPAEDSLCLACFYCGTTMQRARKERADTGTASVCGKANKKIQMAASLTSGCGAPF